MVADCGSYLFACGKISNMQLSQNNLLLQAIWLEDNWSMTDPIYSVSHILIFFRCLFWHTCNCFSFFMNRMFAFILQSEYTTSCFMAKSVVWHNEKDISLFCSEQSFYSTARMYVLFVCLSDCKYLLFHCVSNGRRFSFRTVDHREKVELCHPQYDFRGKESKLNFADVTDREN